MKSLKKSLVLVLGIVLAMTISVKTYAAPAFVNYAVAARAWLTSPGTVGYTATLASIPASDDGMMYLYALQPYEYSVTATDVQVGVVPASANPTFSFNLVNAAGVNQITSKFALCVKIGGVPTMIANAQYITNPEVAATKTRAPQPTGYVLPYEKMVLYRIGETDVSAIARDGYSTAVIVNKVTPSLINPYALKADAHPCQKMYYAFNAADPVGVATLQQTMTTFAGNTKVDQFIIGNEVNTRIWNYTATINWDTFVREYVQAFRVCYNAIKSTNANAKVYISLDQCWDRNRTSDYSFMDGVDFLTKFNEMICAEGNIDWALAFHPYLTPLTYAKFWDMSGCANGSYYSNQISTGKMVSFQNLPVMTTFMCTPGMLNTKGQVREIICPEIGVTSAQGIEVQAAAMVACYQACRNNPYIKQIYFHRINEGGQLNFGTTGFSEQVYQAICTGNLGTYDQWAKGYIGIADWRQAVMY